MKHGSGIRGGHNPTHRHRYETRNRLLIALHQQCWPDIPPEVAAREMETSFSAFRTHQWPAATEPQFEPAATWWRVANLFSRRDGTLMKKPLPLARNIEKILRRVSVPGHPMRRDWMIL
jgi:hypothetical protein